MSDNTKKLFDISDIRRFFHRNETPIYFISATNFNLLGMDEWCRNFKFVSYIDCFDGMHPNVLVPSKTGREDFGSIEDINNYLLQHKEVLEYIRSRGDGGKAVFLMFDEETEALAEKAGLTVLHPNAALRNTLDDKIETVRMGDKAGVPSVPNVLSELVSYDELRACAGHLGENLVLQTAYGDSGHTTFFISNEGDWRNHEDEIVGQGEVKIMKRINCRQAALEACTTRVGTIIGPLMTEIVGFKELTPYKGGWAGNEIFADAFSPAIRQRAHEMTTAFGAALLERGYKGYFELDFLIDIETEEVWLGEVNPRVTGASSITNHAAFAHADAPLFLFHLLEFADVDFDFDVDGLNQRWVDPDNIDDWSQLVIKHVDDNVDMITSAPKSGIWRLGDDGSVNYARFDYHRRAIESENEAFFLRISDVGDYRYEGADLGILITRGRLMTENFALNERAKQWISGLRMRFSGVPVKEEPGVRSISPGSFKFI